MELSPVNETEAEGLLVSCRDNSCSGVRNGAIVQGQESNSLENVMAEGCKKDEEALNNGSTSLIIFGRNYQYTKRSNGMLATERHKPKYGSRKQASVSLETRKSDCHTLPVLSGPCFRHWSRGRKEGTKHCTEDGCHLQEDQRQKDECFSSHEDNKIIRGSDSQFNGEEFICLSTQCKSLESAIQGRGLPKESHAWVKTEPELQAWQSTRKIPAESKDYQFINVKLLRRKLISFYDHSSGMQPFEGVVGENLNQKHRPSEVKFTSAFQQEIFPFAVPYLRLPLLPASKHHLGKISEVLTSCELLPWQLQDISSEYKRQQTEKPLDFKTKASNQEIKHDYCKVEEAAGKRGLQVFIPTE